MQHFLSNITGFDLETFTPSEIFKEANRKFNETHIIINEGLVLVNSFNAEENCIKTNNGDIYADDLFSIKPWMPKAGIYKVKKDTYVYLSRLPRRQWLKSISLGNNYMAFYLHDYSSAHKSEVLKQIYLLSTIDKEIDESRNWLLTNRQIIFKYHKVAEILDTSWPCIKVTDIRFHQEVYDKWNKQYTVTTD